MKKFFSRIILAAVTVFAAACTEEHVGPDSSDAIFTLRLQTAEMETRATVTETGNVIPGEGIENTLTHADFFFFADAEGNTLLHHSRLSVGAGGLISSGTNIYEYTFDVSNDGNPLQNASYVYVIANYPSEIAATTLSSILDLDIDVDLSGSYTSFVMDSYDSATGGRLTYLSPSKISDSKTYTIGLTRAAAKLVLSLNVKDEYVDAAENVWTPVTGQMWVNFVNARKVAKVVAEPVAFDSNVNYFATSEVAPSSVESTLTGYTSWSHPAVYTYPQQYLTSDVTAPYYKIFIPWVCEKKGQNNFYYKIILPELGSFKRNKIYKLTVDVSVIGGTEEDWALVADHIFVADWWAPEKIESSVEGAMYLDVPVKKYDIYGINYIDVPVVSSNDIEVVEVTGTKQNLYGSGGNGVPYNVSVSPLITYSADGKSSFRLTHELNNDITSPGFDCTPITYTMKVKHKTGGLSKTVLVTITQYPSIYAERDPSNSSGSGSNQRGYVYVNSYTNARNHGGRFDNYNAYNNNGNSLSSINYGSAVNKNYNQYVVSVSVLPVGYRVAGLSEDVIIGDPRGGQLRYNYLGYTAGSNGSNGTDSRIVQANYSAVSPSTQNIIAPVIRIASSWGATLPVNNYDRAEERCAAYQENGYPAGRWRIPTVAEIDFLIRLSEYEHIPELFSPGYSNNRYSVYWAGGHYGYGGKPYLNMNHTSAAVNLTNATDYGNYLSLNGENFLTYMRCVYDEWYWGSEKYGNDGQQSTTAATQWIGYIF